MSNSFKCSTYELVELIAACWVIPAQEVTSLQAELERRRSIQTQRLDRRAVLIPRKGSIRIAALDKAIFGLSSLEALEYSRSQCILLGGKVRR